MLAKKSRLKKNNDFDLVFKKGKSAYGKLLGVKIINNQKASNRFGIILGLKVSKKAVIRNLFKRRIRAIIRGEQGRFKNGYDVVVIVLPAISGAAYQDILSELKIIFERLKFYQKP